MLRRSSAFLWSASIFVLGLNSGSAAAQEPPTLSGRWSASALTSKWVIGQWGDACGPKPGGGGAPGGEANIAQVGKELMITGGGRTYSTKSCWEEYPGLKIVSHGGGARSWKTTCKTSAGDPRQANVTTTLQATDDTISFYEAGQYQFVIKGQNCTASVGRYRTYKLVQRAGETPPPVASAKAVPAPSAKPKPVDRCAEVGPVSRLEVRPSRKLLRAGETFAFRTVVADAKGCPVRSLPTWTVVQGAEHAEVSPTGSVTIGGDAPETVIELTATVGDRSAKVTVEVASKEKYEALLASGDFDQAGEVPEAAGVAVASKSVGAKSVIAEDKAAGRKTVFVAIVGLVAAVLGVAGVLVVRRSRKQQPVPPEVDSVDSVPPYQPPVPVVASPPAPRKICPICGTHYPPESQFCGQDGVTLVPLN